jgi:hypothetical protein
MIVNTPRSLRFASKTSCAGVALSGPWRLAIGDISFWAAAIELTRFPVPDDEDHAATDTEAALVRAGDLIGQLGDPLYPRKLNALYHEFVETGVHEKLGYTSPADLVDHYPQFYWSKIEHYIDDALRYLEMTMEGKQWIATLYCHIFAIEHNRRRMGPQPGPSQQPK